MKCEATLRGRPGEEGSVCELLKEDPVRIQVFGVSRSHASPAQPLSAEPCTLPRLQKHLFLLSCPLCVMRRCKAEACVLGLCFFVFGFAFGFIVHLFLFCFKIGQGILVLT